MTSIQVPFSVVLVRRAVGEGGSRYKYLGKNIISFFASLGTTGHRFRFIGSTVEIDVGIWFGYILMEKGSVVAKLKASGIRCEIGYLDVW